MKILIYTAIDNRSVLPYLIKDVIDALRELNQEVYVLDIYNIESGKTFFSMGRDVIDSFKPDFVFTLNAAGLPSRLLIELKIPFATWFTVDPTLLLKHYDISPYHYLFVISHSLIPELKGAGFEHVHYLPLASNPKIFRPISLSLKDIYRYKCDLSFAGIYNRSIGFRENKEKIFEFFGKDVVDSLINLQSKDPMAPIQEMLEQVSGNRRIVIQNEDAPLAFEYLKFIEFEAMNQFRKLVILALSKFEVSLYGDEGWLEVRHPHIRYHGSIDRKKLPRLYQATKINLNIPVSGIKDALNMSSFDIPASGGFMISPFRKDLINLFKEGEEVVCFKNERELQELVDYYLKNEKEREEMANNARERVLKEHTFQHRMKKVLQVMHQAMA